MSDSYSFLTVSVRVHFCNDEHIVATFSPLSGDDKTYASEIVALNLF